jgi:hypothetical protein
LSELSEIIKNFEEEKKKEKVDEDVLIDCKDQLMKLSNKFYTIIPHVFDKGKIPLIDNESILKDKITMLDALRDMEAVTSLLKDDNTDESEKKEDEELDLVDQHYKKLKTDIVPIEKDDEEYKMVEKYLKNTHGSTHDWYTLDLIDVFRVKREGEEERYTKKYKDMGNKQLLWHGSRITNFGGIFGTGLRIVIILF